MKQITTLAIAIFLAFGLSAAPAYAGHHEANPCAMKDKMNPCNPWAMKDDKNPCNPNPCAMKHDKNPCNSNPCAMKHKMNPCSMKGYSY